MTTYVYHHLGLGDHIICNGLVRSLLHTSESIVLLCYSHNETNVRYMYRDEPRITILPFDNENLIISFIENNSAFDWRIIGQRDPKFNELVSTGTSFDAAFYEIAKVPFHHKFTKFYLQRDLEAEETLYQTLNPNNDPFIYLQDDADRGFNLNLNIIRKDLRIIKNDISFKVFDYLTLLERAQEIHLMESSVHALVDNYRLVKPKLFLHKYVRNYPEWCAPVGLNNFTEIW